MFNLLMEKPSSPRTVISVPCSSQLNYARNSVHILPCLGIFLFVSLKLNDCYKSIKFYEDITFKCIDFSQVSSSWACVLQWKKMYIFLSNGPLLCLLKHCSPLIFPLESSFLDFPGAYLFDLICY